jgi:folate-binding protein YgfZ
MLFRLASRALLRLSGDDAFAMIDDIVTTEIGNLPQGEIRAGALLTPQGRILFDLIFSRDGDDLLIETDTERRDALMSKLKLYRMRRTIEIVLENTPVHAVIGSIDGMIHDLRFPVQAGRFYGRIDAAKDELGFTRLRWQHGVFEGAAEMIPEKALPLEARLDLNEGIGFDKGCYIGQEVTARTRHRGLVKRSFIPVRLDAMTDTPIQVTAAGKDAGDLLACLPDGDAALGLASIRLGFLEADAPSLSVGNIEVKPFLPPRLSPLPGRE